MKIKLFVEREGREREYEFNGSTVRDLLNELGFPESEFIVIVNGKIVLSNYKLKEGDYVEIVDVVSGG